MNALVSRQLRAPLRIPKQELPRLRLQLIQRPQIAGDVRKQGRVLFLRATARSQMAGRPACVTRKSGAQPFIPMNSTHVAIASTGIRGSFRLFRESDVDRVGERISLVARGGHQRHGCEERLAFGFVQRHLPPVHLQLDLGRIPRCTGVTDLSVQTAHQDGRFARHEIDETMA